MTEKTALTSLLAEPLITSAKNRELAVYGAGAAGLSLINLTGIQPRFFLQTEASENSVVRGIELLQIDRFLRTYDYKDFFIVVASLFASDICELLTNRGLVRGKDFDLAPKFAPNRLILHAPDRKSFRQAISWLNRSVPYVRIRWFEEFFTEDDWDVLVRGRDLPRILEQSGLSAGEGAFSVDLKWDEPLGFLDEQLYFPSHISRMLLEQAVWSESGFFRVPERLYPLVFAYHLLFQKFPEVTGLSPERPSPADGHSKYRNEFFKLFGAGGEFSQDWLFQFLRDQEGVPEVSVARYWASVHRNSFLEEKFSKIHRPGAHCAFVLRSGASAGQREMLLKNAAEAGLVLESSHLLSERHSEWLASRTRGGIWKETPASILGGLPREVLFFEDRNPDGKFERHSPGTFDFTVQRWSRIKRRIRSEASKLPESDGRPNINWLHSADDGRESAGVQRVLRLLPADGNGTK